MNSGCWTPGNTAFLRKVQLGTVSPLIVWLKQTKAEQNTKTTPPFSAARCASATMQASDNEKSRQRLCLPGAPRRPQEANPKVHKRGQVLASPTLLHIQTFLTNT